MMILLCALWNVQYILSKNQYREYSSYITVHLHSLTIKYECFTCTPTYTTTYDLIESIKTASMENVSTGVLEKIKNNI